MQSVTSDQGSTHSDMGASASTSSDLSSMAQPAGSAGSAGCDADFPNKMTSLGEVQRIIGLSLSKIQMGRNQRGGLPLHKNLLVATVLNKARDLYMQETMYMNYKMMTGQFAAAAAANNNQQDQMQQHAQHYQHYQAPGVTPMHPTMTPHGPHDTPDDDMEPVEANEADYDEDSESDVEDECDVTSVANTTEGSNTSNNHMQYPNTTMASMLSLHMHMQQQQMQQQQQQQQQEQQQVEQQAAAADQPANGVRQPSVSSNSDEGFIDEPDCDCDARNFSTSESRVPFQYCYNCAPFHPSNGRGPTLVPSPCPSPTPASVPSCSSQTPSSSSEPSKDSAVTDNSVIYNMDSQSTEIENCNVNRGSKRRRSSSDSLEDTDSSSEVSKRRRESTDTSPDTSRDESGYLSDSSQHEVNNTFDKLRLSALLTISTTRHYAARYHSVLTLSVK